MKRREALGALLGAATFTRIPAAELKPTDIIVVSIPGRISDEQAERMKALFHEHAWPNHKILILSDGATVQVVAGK